MRNAKNYSDSMRCATNKTYFFFNDTATTEIYTLSLHDALPILERSDERGEPRGPDPRQLRQGQIGGYFVARSEEHTSELQSQSNLVCRLLLEKKKNPEDFIPRMVEPGIDALHERIVRLVLV